MRQKTIYLIIFMITAALVVSGCAKKESTIAPTTKKEKLKTNVTIQEPPNAIVQPDAVQTQTKSTATEQTTAKKPAKTTTQPVTTPTQTIPPTKKVEPTPAPKPQQKPMQITSPAFSSGGNIPAEYTCSGSDVNPQLNIANIPDTAKSLAFIMDDPDAPNGTWVHWIIFNIDPKTSVINKNSIPSGATQGTNSWGKASYGGPCPPSGTHRYYFKIYALDTTLTLGSSATKASVEATMSGHIISQTSLMGKYAK